jgi:PBP1b-binding outer membrane lipoprotein LpoB
MKKYSTIIFAILLALLSVSCDNAQKKNNHVAPKAIQAIAPKAMYDVLLNDSSAQLIDVRTKSCAPR